MGDIERRPHNVRRDLQQMADPRQAEALVAEHGHALLVRAHGLIHAAFAHIALARDEIVGSGLNALKALFAAFCFKFGQSIPIVADGTALIAHERRAGRSVERPGAPSVGQFHGKILPGLVFAGPVFDHGLGVVQLAQGHGGLLRADERRGINAVKMARGEPAAHGLGLTQALLGQGIRVVDRVSMADDIQKHSA